MVNVSMSELQEHKSNDAWRRQAFRRACDHLHHNYMTVGTWDKESTLPGCKWFLGKEHPTSEGTADP